MRGLVWLFSFVVACGSSTPRPKGASTERPEVGKTAADDKKPDEKPEAPKVASKYPEPYMEPDCAVPQAEGHLGNAKQAVADLRKAHWKQFEACAEAAPTGQNVNGEIRTQFRLDPDGVPRCVEAPGSSAPLDVVRCVLLVYRSFRFSPGPKNGSIRVTDGIHLDVSHEDE